MSDEALGAGPAVVPVLAGGAMRLRNARLNPSFLTGLVLLGIVILVAIAAPLLTPYDPISAPVTSSVPTTSAGISGAVSRSARASTCRSV